MLFRSNSSSFDFRENPCKTPKENQKNCFSFALCVFWIHFRGLFAVVPLDLNFKNPKSKLRNGKNQEFFSFYFHSRFPLFSASNGKNKNTNNTTTHDKKNSDLKKIHTNLNLQRQWPTGGAWIFKEKLGIESRSDGVVAPMSPSVAHWWA